MAFPDYHNSNAGTQLTVFKHKTAQTIETMATLLEEIKLVIMENYEFRDRYLPELIAFRYARTIMIPTQVIKPINSKMSSPTT